MSIIRGPRPDSNFYILDKKISEDKRLSWAARGLLVYLLGKPDHWQVSPQALINETSTTRAPVGRDGIRTIIGELMAAGYIRRTPARDAGGKMAGYDYHVSEECAPVAATAEPATAEPATAEPATAEPATAEPATAEPATAKTPQASIEVKQELKKTEQGLKKSASAPAPRTVKAGFPIPDGVQAQAWADYMAIRKAKRAPMTETALAALVREAGKAGVDLNTAVTACAEYGWQGFNAGWYAERVALATPAYKSAPASYQSRNKQEDLEARNREVARKWAAGE